MKYLGVKYYKDVNIILNDSAKLLRWETTMGVNFPEVTEHVGRYVEGGPTAVHTSALDYRIKA